MTDKNGQTKKNVGAPSGLTPFHLEANRSTRGLSLFLSGIIGISDFSDDYIRLMSHGGRILVNGKRLFINVYENNSVEIVGRVEEIVFSYGKN
nr:hypothetical protein [Oscillospiraceae bacterium]